MRKYTVTILFQILKLLHFSKFGFQAHFRVVWLLSITGQMSIIQIISDELVRKRKNDKLIDFEELYQKTFLSASLF